MRYTFENLDTPICQLVEGADNTQTMREFIEESEEEFGLYPGLKEIITEDGLNAYIDWLDDLWGK